MDADLRVLWERVAPERREKILAASGFATIEALCEAAGPRAADALAALAAPAPEIPRPVPIEAPRQAAAPAEAPRCAICQGEAPAYGALCVKCSGKTPAEAPKRGRGRPRKTPVDAPSVPQDSEQPAAAPEAPPAPAEAPSVPQGAAIDVGSELDAALAELDAALESHPLALQWALERGDFEAALGLAPKFPPLETVRAFRAALAPVDVLVRLRAVLLAQ